MRKLSLTVLFVMLGAASVCSADIFTRPITYGVDLTVGTAQVTGFIETNGTLGILGDDAILNWNLELSDSVNACPSLPCTYDLTGPDNTVGNDGLNEYHGVGGSDLTATRTQLSFNFGGTDLGDLIFDAGGRDYVCIGDAGTCVYLPASGAYPPGVEVVIGDPDTQFAVLSGTQVIGTVSTTPEPSYIAVSAGIIALIGFRKLRIKSLISN
jgi:hypothetical protein